MDDFAVNERVVCISDRCPCCDDKLDAATKPEVGEVYVVGRVGIYADDVTKGMLAFVPKDIDPARIWPQCNFKRIPPRVDIKDKQVGKPVPVPV